jgi:hypothetical protein
MLIVRRSKPHLPATHGRYLTRIRMRPQEHTKSPRPAILPNLNRDRSSANDDRTVTIFGLDWAARLLRICSMNPGSETLHLPISKRMSGLNARLRSHQPKMRP